MDLLRAAVLVGLCSLGLPRSASAGPTLGQPGPGGAPQSPSLDACWSQPPDLEGWLISSEVISEFGLATETAGDFILDDDRTITRIRWWGGYYSNDVPCDPGMTPAGFYLRFYESDPDCLPALGPPLIEIFVPGDAGQSLVGCGSGMFPLYRYEAPVSLSLLGGTRYWLSVQIADHPYPPQWGRLAAAAVQGCDGAFRAFLPWWEPLEAIVGVPLDLGQELECDVPVAVQARTWGQVKALYR
jgi:hypothetical protein